MKKIIYISVILVLGILINYDAYSIPAFARQYSLSCKTCHAPAPKLKPYGEEFAANGFQLKDIEAPRYFQETGDDKLSLMRSLPVAIRLDVGASYNTYNNKSGDFSSPYIIKLLSGGAISKDISYYFYFFFSERGEIAGIEDAYIMFNDLFDIDLDLYLGQFQICDPLFKRELRLTFEDYEIYRTKIGLNNANLTYDRGALVTLGLETGTDIMLEIVNGNGIHAADDNKVFDNDKNKNIFVRASQEITDFLRVGAFGYFGRQDLNNELNKSTAKFNLFGPDFTIKYKDIAELNCQYVLRNDEDVLLDEQSAPSKKLETQGGFAELIITPRGDETGPYGVLLYNTISSDIKELDKSTFTIHLGHAIKRNLRFYLEGTYNDLKKDDDYFRINLGLMSGF